MSTTNPFTCPQCTRTSWNPLDVKGRLCGNCHVAPGTSPPFYVVSSDPHNKPEIFVAQEWRYIQFSATALPRAN